MNRWLILALLSMCLVPALRAEPVVPRSDDEVIETLNDKASRTEERALRRAWAANPADARVAVALARRYLDQAHAQGDPRYSGRAMAALSAWPHAATAPDDVLLLQATLRQYLHEFDPAAALLETLVARNPRHAQAWLTLATVRRVQGQLDASERACSGVASAGAVLYAQACRAENIGLRGDFDTARASLERLLAAGGLPGSTRNWLFTSLAELEARAARPVQAERAYLAALQAQADAYTVLSYGDFLMARGRAADVLAVLKDQPRSDVVLLRLAIAGARAGAPRAPADVAELRERMAQAALRPDAQTTHAREQAMFALWVESRPERALELARANLQLQREPLDLWLLAEAARATGRAADVQDARRIVEEAGLHDKRLDALL